MSPNVDAGSELLDAGLPTERTALAWRRTALSVALGSLVAFRLLPELLGDPLWAGAGSIGVVGAGLMWATSELRYRAFHRGEVPMPHAPFGAWPLLILATCVVLLGLGAIGLAVNLASA